MSITKKLVISEPLCLERATEFATMEPMPGERDEEPTRIKRLHDLLDDGQFQGVDWHFASDLKTGKRFRVDGQHSSKMLAALSSQKVPVVLATITEWEVDDITSPDGYFLFEKFNQPWSTRTASDVMGVGTAQCKDLAGVVPKPFLVSVAKGVSAWIKAKNDSALAEYQRRKKKDPDAPKPKQGKLPKPRQLSVYFREEERRKFAIWAHGMSKNPMEQPVLHRSLLSQAGILAEMYDEWRENVESTTVFWTWVLNASHPDPEHESRELANEYLETKAKAKRITQEKLRQLARKYYRRYLVSASSPSTHQMFGTSDNVGQQPSV